MFTFRLLVFSTIVSLIFLTPIGIGLYDVQSGEFDQYYYGTPFGKESRAGLIISSLVLVHHLGSKLLARYWLLWWDCVLLLAEVVSVTWILGVLLGPNMFDGPWWITLCMSTCLMLLLLLFNLGRGLRMLYSTKTERWSMRIQHMDNRSNAGPGSGRFHEALHRLAWALFGQYFLRKRFKFEKASIRLIRGLSALCLLVIFVVVAYDVLVVRPISDQSSVLIARYRSLSFPYLQSLSRTPWMVSITPVYSYPANMSSFTQVYRKLRGVARGLACPYIEHFDEQSYFNCSSIPGRSYHLIYIGELFIVVNSTSMLEDDIFMIKLSLGSEYIYVPLAWGHSFPLLPNVHLWATLSTTTEQLITNKKSAALGIPKFQTSHIFNIDKVFPDPNPLIAGENISSLRVLIPENYIDLPGSNESVKEIEQSTVLNGVTILGGLWTFMSGAFAIIFGSSLLLVAFGLKPMSVYGLVHLLQGGRVSLAEGSSLTDEEQIRTVAILREHLMDVGDPDAEGLAESSDVSNELGVIESQGDTMLERRDTDLEVGLQVVNPQHSGDVRRDS